jgi:hypothetical protein
VGFHLIYTSTFRIDTVQSESEVLVKVVKVEHAVRMLHGCRCTVDAPSYYYRKITPSEFNIAKQGVRKITFKSTVEHYCTSSLTVLLP